MLRVLIFCLLISTISFGQKKKDKKVKIEQPAKQIIREGNSFYNNSNFSEAENQYRKALEINPNYEKANYNLGNAVYQQDRFEEAVPMYDLVTKTTDNKTVKAENFHNIGNAMMKQKQYDKAIDAYKNALRNNPNDDETRYNLALAQKLLNKQADNKKDDKNNKDKNDKNDENKDEKQKDKNDDKDNKKNKDEGDNGDKDKDKKGDNKEDPNKDKQGENEKKKQQPQPQNKLSKQQIKQLLEAMNNEENKTQKKINAKKAKGKKIKQEKDW